MNRFVYLDNNATTKISERVQERIKPFLNLQFGNPSSKYQHGEKIKEELTIARENCAKLINANPKNVIFTSGGSESNCAAFNSAVLQNKKRKIVTTKVEHASILEYCKLLEKQGYEVVYLNVDKNCNLSKEEIIKVVDGNTCLVSIQYANNEVGSVLLTSEILKTIKQLKQKFGFVFHADCVQGLGKTQIDVKKLGVDFASFSGHKIHAPKGVGMLYIKDIKNFVPLIAGHQEFMLRGGTENVVGIVGLGEACKSILENFENSNKQIAKVNEYLENRLREFNGLTINCIETERIPNTTSITFKNYVGNKIMFELDRFGICVSTGSACNSMSADPSHVLTAMKIKNPQNTIRVSIDENTSISQIDYFIEKLKEVSFENR